MTYKKYKKPFLFEDKAIAHLKVHWLLTRSAAFMHNESVVVEEHGDLLVPISNSLGFAFGFEI